MTKLVYKFFMTDVELLRGAGTGSTQQDTISPLQLWYDTVQTLNQT